MLSVAALFFKIKHYGIIPVGTSLKMLPTSPQLEGRPAIPASQTTSNLWIVKWWWTAIKIGFSERVITARVM